MTFIKIHIQLHFSAVLGHYHAV